MTRPARRGRIPDRDRQRLAAEVAQHDVPCGRRPAARRATAGAARTPARRRPRRAAQPARAGQAQEAVIRRGGLRSRPAAGPRNDAMSAAGFSWNMSRWRAARFDLVELAGHDRRPSPCARRTAGPRSVSLAAEEDDIAVVAAPADDRPPPRRYGRRTSGRRTGRPRRLGLRAASRPRRRGSASRRCRSGRSRPCGTARGGWP